MPLTLDKTAHKRLEEINRKHQQPHVFLLISNSREIWHIWDMTFALAANLCPTWKVFTSNGELKRLWKENISIYVPTVSDHRICILIILLLVTNSWDVIHGGIILLALANFFEGQILNLQKIKSATVSGLQLYLYQFKLGLKVNMIKTGSRKN